MAQLRQDHALFEERDSIVVAIGPENREAFAKYWKDNGLTFIGIPDPKHEVADLYGQEMNLIKLGRMPAQMIVDKKGILRYVRYGRSMKDIPNNKDILGLLDDIQSGT